MVMDVVEDYPIRRFDAGAPEAAGDKVVAEARVELDVNDGQFRLAMLCLPRELDALAVGFLAGEGALRSRADLRGVEVDQAAGRIRVVGDLDADALEAVTRRWTWGTGCGGGGTGRDMDAPAYAAVGPGLAIGAGRLGELAAEFQGRAKLWAQTGGVHACALAWAEGIIFYAEDVGRHNAFDKVIGRALLDGVDVTDKLMLTTGRLSAEIVSKAVACRVPLLASRSAVTTLSASLARRFGVTLVGFLRGRRLNVYTGFERVLADPV
ncbi:MAG TPA: formate dehydrogenase accessory sulfurtransferase FdhD [Phycisphaerae bacterium]|nr:formate dehydrogenase accessory sulfurtransferase FdhD [Phycisphaerae bacterium]